MSHDDIREIARIVARDNAYAHFMKRIKKEFEIADEERNTHVYVLYQKDRTGKDIGFAVIGHSAAKMKTWEMTFKEEGWVSEDFAMVRPSYELMYMYIRPEVRRKGWGSKLFDEVLDFTVHEGIKGIYAYVGDKGPAAINFYKQKGAVIVKNLSDNEVTNAFLEFKLA